MPTRTRRVFAEKAIMCFLEQTWPEKELVILDDLDSPSLVQPFYVPDVRYHVTETRMTLGHKRNRLCELARGEVIAHWDDDDYSAPQRLETQLDRLLSTGAQMTGYRSMVFQEESGTAWMYRGSDGFALGTSLMYRREYWKANPFRNLNIGEDDIFRGKALREGTLTTVPAGRMMLARIHSSNTLKKDPVGDRWERIAA